MSLLQIILQHELTAIEAEIAKVDPTIQATITKDIQYIITGLTTFLATINKTPVPTPVPPTPVPPALKR